MNRRGFLGMAAASIFVPQFGRFFREGNGRLWTPVEAQYYVNSETANVLDDICRQYFAEHYRTVYRTVYPALLQPSPLLAQFRTLASARSTGRPWFGVVA